jgi:hypothetical protein
MILMFIVNFVIETKFPLALCVLKTVKMICNSIVYRGIFLTLNIVHTNSLCSILKNTDQ